MCIVCIGLAYTLGCVLCACGGVCGCVGVCVQILQLYLSCPGSKKNSRLREKIVDFVLGKFELQRAGYIVSSRDREELISSV